MNFLHQKNQFLLFLSLSLCIPYTPTYTSQIFGSLTPTNIGIGASLIVTGMILSSIPLHLYHKRHNAHTVQVAHINADQADKQRAFERERIQHEAQEAEKERKVRLQINQTKLDHERATQQQQQNEQIKQNKKQAIKSLERIRNEYIAIDLKDLAAFIAHKDNSHGHFPELSTYNTLTDEIEHIRTTIIPHLSTEEATEATTAIKQLENLRAHISKEKLSKQYDVQQEKEHLKTQQQYEIAIQQKEVETRTLQTEVTQLQKQIHMQELRNRELQAHNKIAKSQAIHTLKGEATQAIARIEQQAQNSCTNIRNKIEQDIYPLKKEYHTINTRLNNLENKTQTILDDADGRWRQQNGHNANIASHLQQLKSAIVRISELLTAKKEQSIHSTTDELPENG